MGLLAILVILYFAVPGLILDWAYQAARWRAGLKRKELLVAKHNVSYLEGGKGQPLVLIHGFGANKDHWTMVSSSLTKRFHDFAFDLPGFGESSRLETETYSDADQLSRILAITDSLVLEYFHLGGNSMGGYLSALFANMHPDKVASLWLLAPAGIETAKPSEVLEMIERGDNPLIIKGVHCLEDAQKAEEFGADGVIFSNHGGRQLGQAIPTLQIVAEIMPKLKLANSKLDCAMDGGIRNGMDVLIGLSYEFKAVGLGRVVARGLGAGGYIGKTKTFELMKEDLHRSMELLGVQDISEIHEQGEKFRRESMVNGTEYYPKFMF